MRIHAIRTGGVWIRSRQREGYGRGIMRRVNTLLDREWTEQLPIWAWVIEHPEGLIVVDTGETAKTADPDYFPRWHPYFRFGVRVDVKPEEEIGPQLKALGLSPDDVRWVILTHLNTDHAGGLHHFPKAEMLVSPLEYQTAIGFRGVLRGYLPHRWPTWFSPRLVNFSDGPVGPFSKSQLLTRAQDVILVPTPGHTYGHLSVIVKQDDHDVFLAGDTSYTEQLMKERKVDGVAPSEELAADSLSRIAQFCRARPTIYLPSHDAHAQDRLVTRRYVQDLFMDEEGVFCGERR
ncbi:MAG: N-acyl homoserine lactonase family protein [Alicyclobacillus sp.]|nr:N-acyl homoserine lactonase family protein [Alicyclobacillus sp.]